MQLIKTTGFKPGYVAYGKQSSGSQALMEAAVKPQAINQLQLILNAAHRVLYSWPRVKEEKSAISCCLSVGISKLITEMHSLSPPGPEAPRRTPHSVASEERE